MRNWPRTFKQYIDERKQQLLAKREELARDMRMKIEGVFKEIEKFRATIAAVLGKGLTPVELEYDAELEPSVGSVGSDEKPRSLSAEEQAAKAAEA